MLRRVVVERQQLVKVIGNLRGSLGEPRPVGRVEGLRCVLGRGGAPPSRSGNAASLVACLRQSGAGLGVIQSHSRPI